MGCVFIPLSKRPSKRIVRARLINSGPIWALPVAVPGVVVSNTCGADEGPAEPTMAISAGRFFGIL